jgi:hypothetical protein
MHACMHAGLEMEVDAVIRDTLELLCSPQRQRAAAVQSRGVSGSHMEHSHREESEISVAEAKSVPDEESTGAGEQHEVGKTSLWMQALQRLLLQLLLAGLLIGLFWWRGELPYQRKARRAASVGLETEFYHGTEL